MIDFENNFIGYGCLWNSRQPQIELKLDNGFYVAVIQPETKSSVKTGLPGVVVHEDTTIPKICVGYEFETAVEDGILKCNIPRDCVAIDTLFRTQMARVSDMHPPSSDCILLN